MSTEVLVLLESNTTGTGRLFCASARARGLRPVVLTRDPARYPYLAEDDIDHVVVDTNDAVAVRAALPDHVRGVTSSSELFIGPAASIARELGLPHPDPEAVALARDKAAMRAALRSAGLPGPGFAQADSVDAAVRVAADIGFPVVVKPVHGTGSAGVRLCTDQIEVKAAAAELDPRPVLVESYLDGPEYSVETFDGAPVVVVAKHLGPRPHFVETGHDLPAPVPAATRSALGRAAAEALSALGLRWGAAHVELRDTAAGPRVVEVNPRLAGGMIPAAISGALGIDLVDAVVARALGEPVDLTPRRALSAAIRFVLTPGPGTVTAVDGVEEAEGVPGVERVGVLAQPGTEVRVRNSFQDRLGYVVAVGADPTEARATADGAAGLLRWRLTGPWGFAGNGAQ
ncbi:ATP-grasp domain-containing protein [Actinokineospora sp. NBRC 105648]|uniref:ATP-grasp domain-containing protein n=1 Tax=Actinokineospora sp. NBRC 105648 TaxID=3032206 RepID=UPI0024A0A5D9|nr:ATP-grasp domain-containing protein [Actinokineospora sp. NBRC 105648]GLZ41098.1 argininosuccinate lyase [Actinokineospora sp. NBRC 105648]